MSLCPFATQLLLPESATQRAIVPRAIILHSAAGTGSLHRFFLNSSNLESHFWVGLDGTIEQYIDTDHRADANLNANSFALSVETENHRDNVNRNSWDDDPWSDEQIASLVRLADWMATTHPAIKRQLISTWDGSGIGWHIQFGTPGPWTPVAKACPGRARIAQVTQAILPAFVGVQTTPQQPQQPPQPVGAFMALSDQEQDEVLQVVRDLKRYLLTEKDGKVWTERMRDTLAEVDRRTTDIDKRTRP